LSAILFALALAGAQPPQQPVRIRPTDYAPEARGAVAPSEVAQPMALAIAGFDGDSDGRTTRAELDEALGRTFAAADANNDSQLGYIEYSGWALTWMGSQNALPGPFSIDSDGDDRLSRQEVLNEFGRHFIRLDADANGAVTRAELLTVRNPALRPLPRDLRLMDLERRRQRR